MHFEQNHCFSLSNMQICDVLVVVGCLSSLISEEANFRFLGTIGFHVKAKNERFTAAGLRCRQDIKNENFTSFDKLRRKSALKSVLHAQHDYFSSFNQSHHWFVALSLPLLSWFLKLSIILVFDGRFPIYSSSPSVQKQGEAIFAACICWADFKTSRFLVAV